MNRQRGYTLVELLVVIAIGAAVTTACVMVAWSVIVNSERNNARVEAVSGIEHAALWISMDGMTAQDATIPSGGDRITLQWQAPAEPGGTVGDLQQVIYSLVDTDLQRDLNGTTKIVAQNVTDINFSAEVSDFREFTVSITASGGSARVTEMREYDVTLRPDA